MFSTVSNCSPFVWPVKSSCCNYFTGEHPTWGSIWESEMQPWGAHFRAGTATPANIWSQQARREGGQFFLASLLISWLLGKILFFLIIEWNWVTSLCYFKFLIHLDCWGLQESKFLKFLGFMWNPLSWVMEAAAIMAIALANGGVSTMKKKLIKFLAFCYFVIGDEWSLHSALLRIDDIFVVIRGSHQTGRTSLVSSRCCLSTQLSVSLRKIMLEMLLRHLWLVLHQKPRSLIIHLVCDISLYSPYIIFLRCLFENWN